MPPDPIVEKIVRAENIYSLLKEGFLKDRTISDLLLFLRAAVHASRRELAGAGIVEVCRQCDENEGGSCCGSGLEDYYNDTLLLINLLLGVGLPRERVEPTDCFFLSKNGCSLLARHVICINYLCQKITDRFHPHHLVRLREKEGIEVELLFRLNEEVKKYLHDRRDHKKNPLRCSPVL